MRMTRHATAAIVATMMAMTAMAMTPTVVAAQTPAGTAFTYQGRLIDSGAPASGVYDLRFTLFDAATSGAAVVVPVVVSDVTVANGLFTVLLDFGPAAFSGDARWLEIAVRPGASSGDFTPLASRQMLTPSPHAIFSQRSQQSLTSEHADAASAASTASAAPWTGITGKPAGFADDVDDDTLATLNCSTPGFVAKWTGSAWSCALDADATGPDWKLAGNTGTGGAAVLGTIDNQPFTLVANGQAALRITPRTNAPSVIGGIQTNTGDFDGATIGGGGALLQPNKVLGIYGTIAGGANNQAYGYASIGGGGSNIADNYGTIAGGVANVAVNGYASIGGGNQNAATAIYATVGGGANNAAVAETSTIGGGESNIADGLSATVPGGAENHALGYYSFAAGRHAFAAHPGTFVWGDNSSPVSSVQSTSSNQFVVRAQSIWFGRTNAVNVPSNVFLNTSTGAYLSDSGTWTNASDRNLKERVEPIDGAHLLDQLARLPITSWSYKVAPDVRHIGPMAQDFLATFNVGDSDKAISTIDPAGIALATIQELHRRIETQDARIAALEALVRQLQANSDKDQR